MLDKIPTREELSKLVGKQQFYIWEELCKRIENRYEMERIWNNGGKAWKYEYKYRRGGKTLCALYAKENVIGFMLIFGKGEREKFEAARQEYSETVQTFYDEATTYHDGKWIMFEMTDTSLFTDLEKLLLIKRKPNKK